jgi:hypothetical protein
MDVPNMHNHAILTDRAEHLSPDLEGCKLLQHSQDQNKFHHQLTSNLIQNIILLDISTYYGQRTWDNVIPLIFGNEIHE